MPIVQKIFSEGKAYSWEEKFEGTGQTLLMTSVAFGEYFVSTGRDISQFKTGSIQDISGSKNC